MSVAVIIPFRSSTILRAALCAQTVKFYEREFPAWEIILADDHGRPFSRGGSINYGVASTEHTIIILNDADSLCRAEQVAAAVTLAVAAPGIVYAYTRYCRLDETGRRVEWSQENTPSHGCSAISRESFEQVGGYAEQFRGWGYEDSELTARLAWRWPVRRVPGDLVHFWHGDRRADDSPLSEDSKQIAKNAAYLHELTHGQ